jgi:hypothetical protein
MSLTAIQLRYRVPAVVGGRVTISSSHGPKAGIIRGGRNGRLRVRLEGERRIRSLHPTWRIRYEPQTAPDRHASLERLYGTPGTFPERRDRYEECTVFADGSAVFFCTNWARYVRRVEGPDRCQLFGFSSDEVPESLIAARCGGHDFAVVDGRYLVDGWLKDLERESDVAVFDLNDPKNDAFILKVYGPREKWPRNHALEDDVDEEKPEARRAALAGAKLWRRNHKRKPIWWDDANGIHSCLNR